MVSVTDDDLSRQQPFTLDFYNFNQCQHTTLINLQIEASHARPVAETTGANVLKKNIENLTKPRQLKRSEKGCVS